MSTNFFVPECVDFKNVQVTIETLSFCQQSRNFKTINNLSGMRALMIKKIKPVTIDNF